VFSRLRLVAPDEGAGPDDTVEAGAQGQVIVSLESDEAFAGYWRRPDADARALRGGWYFTGDLARQDDEGEYWVAGRVDDMINSGGENLYPIEIEDALARCPEVSDVVVAGMPDEKWGQAVTAFVVPRQLGGEEGVLARIDEFVRTSSGLSSLTRPKRIVLVEAVPKSAVGKVLRRELIAGNYVPLADSATGAAPGPQGPAGGGSGG
jgi:2-furoate---CoA ligase